MVKRHAILLALAGFAAVPASTHAAESWMRAQVEALPASVRQVLPCGQWTEASRQGTYRVVEANVNEGAGSELYVQWVTDPLQGEPSRVTKTVAFSELNDDHSQYRFESVQCRARGAAIEITVKARYEHDEDDRLRTFNVRVEPGGGYRVNEAGARKRR
ncbi:hypothetical protein [Paracidovorax cattleyae]|uniref:Uncharacterized protein n=1 Tax=Paracidovorax cattleyae TaxID=80868 RepID=A0A1H0MNT1_9BURK|nr:hypothetical protein [Paracidovorax cattleyae]AVS75772.1 hypothetical protein C8240_18870 [Paracidovorax cattleyae]SDO82004.1 hypothetical protein SAMN04489708_1047 [Paracidovorax cattleyae]